MPVRRHLNPDQLVAAGEGAADEAASAHLAACDRCSRQVTQLARLMTVMRADELEPAPLAARARVLAMLPTPAPRPSLVQRLQAVLRLDSNMGTLAYGMRGGQGKTRQLLYDAGPYEIDLRVRPEGRGWRLSGQLLGDGDAGTVRLTGSRSGYHAEINELGEFDVRDIVPGAYSLVLSVEGTELEISDLQLE